MGSRTMAASARVAAEHGGQRADAAGLLADDALDQDRPRRLQALAEQGADRGDPGHEAALHVAGAPAPEDVAVEPVVPGRHRPAVLVAHGHDVDVAVEDERGRVVVPARQPARRRPAARRGRARRR